MRIQRYPIPPFWTYLLTTAASLTLFLPSAISMNSSTAPKYMQVLSAPKISKHMMVSGKSALHLNPSHQPAIEKVANASMEAIHPAPLQRTKGSLSLQTAAIVGSSAAATAANLVGDARASITVHRLMQER
jgi:hypothetical protein